MLATPFAEIDARQLVCHGYRRVSQHDQRRCSSQKLFHLISPLAHAHQRRTGAVPTDAAPPGQPSAVYRWPFVSLVALLTWQDLLFCAKHLLVAAIGPCTPMGRAPGRSRVEVTPPLTRSQWSSRPAQIFGTLLARSRHRGDQAKWQWHAKPQKLQTGPRRSAIRACVHRWSAMAALYFAAYRLSKMGWN